MSRETVYAGAQVALLTQHGKAAAVAPPFATLLGASVVEHVADTDTLGTFSGEVARAGSALDCARRKCEWAQRESGAALTLASEGSFGPHPQIAFVPADTEILYFIDAERDFHLHVVTLSTDTNYRTATVSSYEALDAFANRVQFPSHALILRPNGNDDAALIHKGITDAVTLSAAFHSCRSAASDGSVRVETDMRAHLNPSRQRVIAGLATTLAGRLLARCPACETPGWGITGLERGLPCEACGSATDWARSETLGCVRCAHSESSPRSDGLTTIDPGHCPRCNP